MRVMKTVTSEHSRRRWRESGSGEVKDSGREGLRGHVISAVDDRLKTMFWGIVSKNKSA